MQAEEVAKTIKEEFNVPCVPYTGDHGAAYYLWNAPHDVYGAELRDLKKRIEQRIAELEQQNNEVEIWHDEITGLPMHVHHIPVCDKDGGMSYLKMLPTPCSCGDKTYDMPPPSKAKRCTAGKTSNAIVKKGQ